VHRRAETALVGRDVSIVTAPQLLLLCLPHRLGSTGGGSKSHTSHLHFTQSPTPFTPRSLSCPHKLSHRKRCRFI